jgi:hypothetical protein
MLIARPHSSQVHAGINKLLMAEKEATEVVKAAKEGERPLRLRSIYRCAQPQSPCEASQHTAPSCSLTVDALPHQCTPARPQH